MCTVSSLTLSSLCLSLCQSEGVWDKPLRHPLLSGGKRPLRTLSYLRVRWLCSLTQQVFFFSQRHASLNAPLLIRFLFTHRLYLLYELLSFQCGGATCALFLCSCWFHVINPILSQLYSCIWACLNHFHSNPGVSHARANTNIISFFVLCEWPRVRGHDGPLHMVCFITWPWETLWTCWSFKYV